MTVHVIKPRFLQWLGFPINIRSFFQAIVFMDLTEMKGGINGGFPLDSDTDQKVKSLEGSKYMSADKFLARPGRKQATVTEDFDFHISYL